MWDGAPWTGTIIILVMRVPVGSWSSFTSRQSSLTTWVRFRTLQRLQCDCANKNALLSCENKELTATKRNPAQFTLPELLQVVASTCRLFDPGGVGGWGRPDRAYVLSTRIGCSRLRGSRMIISWRLSGCWPRPCPIGGTHPAMCFPDYTRTSRGRASCR